MKWFMSYVQIYTDGRLKFGHHTYDSEEHPVVRAGRWAEQYGRTDGFQIVLISFQYVGDSNPPCPESDVLS